MRTSASAQTLIEVPLDNGTTWTGTERELRAKHPDWLPYARRVQPTTPDDSSDVLSEGEQDFYDDPRPRRLPTSTRRYYLGPGQKIRYEFHPETPIRRRSSATTHIGTGTRATEVGPQAKTRNARRSNHWLLYLGIGMFCMLALWTGLQLFLSWWQVHTDDVTYGRPRTAQYDVVVGHNDDADHPTHIIAINLHNRVVIVQIPGGDTSKSRIYSGPQLFGPGSDLAPVTLTFKDTTGSGRLDMIVHVQGADILYLNQRVNTIWQFVPQQNH